MVKHVIGTHNLELAEEEIWTSPATVAVVLHDRYTFNRTAMMNVIELKGLETQPETEDDTLEGDEDAVEMLTASDARALAAILIKAADAAEAAAASP